MLLWVVEIAVYLLSVHFVKFPLDRPNIPVHLLSAQKYWISILSRYTITAICNRAVIVLHFKLLRH